MEHTNIFKVGDKVVALKSTSKPDRQQPVIKGNIYTVLGVMYCNRCGVQAINVTNTTVRCSFLICSCGHMISLFDNYYYSNSKYFVKIDDIDKELEKAVEAEDYETAIILRDINLF